MTILWFLTYTYILIFKKDLEDEGLAIAVIPCMIIDCIIVTLYNLIIK